MQLPYSHMICAVPMLQHLFCAVLQDRWSEGSTAALEVCEILHTRVLGHALLDIWEGSIGGQWTTNKQTKCWCAEFMLSVVLARCAC
jgi:hypothetical protein